MFWHKKKLQSEEFEILLKRVITLEAELQTIRNKVEAVDSNNHSLRGLVNRKLGRVKEEDDMESENSLKNDDLTFSTRRKFGL